MEPPLKFRSSGYAQYISEFDEEAPEIVDKKKARPVWLIPTIGLPFLAYIAY